MNDPKLVDSIVSMVIDTFSDMAFIDVNIITDKKIENDYENVFAIDVIKPFRATIYILLSDLLKKNITNNIYGEDSDKLRENELDDCLLEILNILSGKLLALYLDKSINYKIDFPRIIVDFKKKNYENINYIVFDAEGIIFEAGYEYI
jgi:hypothetical protein